MSRIPRTLHGYDDMWANGPGRGRLRLMFAALLYLADPSGAATVTLERLTIMTCTKNRKSARDTIKLLEADGWFTRIEYGSMYGRPNTYHLNLAKMRGES